MIFMTDFVVRPPREPDPKVQGQSKDPELGKEDGSEAGGARAKEVLAEVPRAGGVGIL